jgi:hypothetical protein
LTGGSGAGQLLREGFVASADVVASVSQRQGVDGGRIVDVRLAGGLTFEVLPERGLDLGALWWSGYPVSWRSPQPPGRSQVSTREDAWLTAWGGGMLTTCRVDNIGPQDSRHGAIFGVRSGAGFDLVAQDEVGAGVAGLGGGQVFTQFGDGGGGAHGGQGVEAHGQDAVLAGVDVSAAGEHLADQGVAFVVGASVVIHDVDAYGCVVLQGHGSMNAHQISAATIIRYGELTSHEFFVSERAAAGGVRVHNNSTTELLVRTATMPPGNREQVASSDILPGGLS